MYMYCKGCVELLENVNICPSCNNVHKPGKQPYMLQCDWCDLWVHSVYLGIGRVTCIEMVVVDVYV